MASIQCGRVRFDHISAVLFDKDGTLADSYGFLFQLAVARARCLEEALPGITPKLLAAFGCQGSKLSPTGLMAVGTRYENEIAAATYLAAAGYSWGESLEIVKAAFVAGDRAFVRKAAGTQPFAGIVALMETLRAAGLKLAVLSGDTTANVQDFLDCYGLAHLVDWCAGSEKPPVKPDPVMLQIACQRLEVLPEHSLVVGDSVLDYQLAQNGGARAFVSVTWGGSPAVPGADSVLATTAEFQAQAEA